MARSEAKPFHCRCLLPTSPPAAWLSAPPTPHFPSASPFSSSRGGPRGCWPPDEGDWRWWDPYDKREYDPGRFGFKGSPRFDDLKLRSPEAAACTRLGVGERRLGSVRFVEEGRWKQQLRRRGSRRPASVASCDAAGRQEAPRRWPHPRRPSGWHQHRYRKGLARRPPPGRSASPRRLEKERERQAVMSRSDPVALCVQLAQAGAGRPLAPSPRHCSAFPHQPVARASSAPGGRPVRASCAMVFKQHVRTMPRGHRCRALKSDGWHLVILCPVTLEKLIVTQLAACAEGNW
ncbi:unnamed protein product [Prorocentrum cordatum]|uniref:Uncharacterized protein n=2 Tax=Prorocentrum cordatum TaxID=2364126 RepID=A0ABN9WLJ4_9DINO|nr:unnamed protein product [Polarella glacialis]